MMYLSVLVIGLLAAPGALAAQRAALPSVPQSLGLDEALELAVRHNPIYRQTTNDRGPAAWGVRNALAQLFMPSFSANGTFNYQGAGSQRFVTEVFTAGSATIGSSYSLGLSWRLSGATLAQPGLARAQLHAAEAAIDGARTTLESTVRQQYLSVLQARAQVELAELQLRRNDEFLRLAQARFQVGQATLLDVRQAEVARGQSEVGLLQAGQTVIVEKLRLFQLMGIPAPVDLSVVTLTDSFPVVEPDWSLGDLLAAADADNPDVNTLRARASAARSSESAAKSEWLPTLDFSAGWSGFSQQFTNDQFLVDRALGSAANARRECVFFNSDLVNPGRPLIDCDDPIFIVRTLWRLYGGWYDGNPAHLKPSKDAELARTLAAAAGGARRLAERAEECCADGDLALACELAEFAWRAEPDDDRTRSVRATVYRESAKAESSLMAKGIYNAAARDCEPEPSGD